MDNWTFEYIFHSLKIQILRNWSKRAERNGDQNYHIYHKKKKKNHLGKKVTTIKFWDKKWRVFWRISSKLGKVWYLGRFSFLPSPGNRSEVRSAQVARTKFITSCQLSHTYFRGKIRVTTGRGEVEHNGVAPVYEQPCIVTVLSSVDERSWFRRYGYKFQLFETLVHLNRVKRFIESRFES